MNLKVTLLTLNEKLGEINSLGENHSLNYSGHSRSDLGQQHRVQQLFLKRPQLKHNHVLGLNDDEQFQTFR